MKTLVKTVTVAVLGLALALPTIDTASAQRRGNVGAAIVGGVIVGAIIAGAASSARAEGRSYTYSRCDEFARNARYAERNDRPGRADYWWNRYNDAGC